MTLNPQFSALPTKLYRPWLLLIKFFLKQKLLNLTILT